MYMDLYRKCDFVCEGCVEFYYDRRRQEMLGIQEIVSIEEYNAIHKPFCNKCESYEWNHTISFKNGDKYSLCNGCVKFFKNIKNKEMAGVYQVYAHAHDLERLDPISNYHNNL